MLRPCINKAQQLEEEGKIPQAALVYSEVAVRLRDHDKQNAGEAEQKVYNLTAEFLRVEKATRYDPSQDKVVASEDLVSAIKDFQARSNIPVNGKLDYKTLRKSAGSDISSFLYKPGS